MTLSRVARFVLIAYVFVYPILAQNWLSVGLKGGVPLTDAFADRTFNYVVATIPSPFGLGTITQTTRTYSGSRDFVLGPSIEVQLPLGLAVEAMRFTGQ